jgi:hypothetical protein
VGVFAKHKITHRERERDREREKGGEVKVAYSFRARMQKRRTA